MMIRRKQTKMTRRRYLSWHHAEKLLRWKTAGRLAAEQLVDDEITPTDGTAVPNGFYFVSV